MRVTGFCDESGVVPKMKEVVPPSWLTIERDSHFALNNLPFGVFSPPQSTPRCGTRIGQHVLDLHSLQEAGYFSKLALPKAVFSHASLNAFFALGRPKIHAVRERLIALLSVQNESLRTDTSFHARLLHKVDQVCMHIPVEVGDYTDFYSSESHARNVGSMFRDKANPLLPNWKHIPVGYHGRASSIIVSGQPIHRPMGQYKPPSDDKPSFGLSRQLDFELEIAFITCQQTNIGTSISVDRAEEAIVGLVLFNDWSARDIQSWEYVPLGPFLGKSFASSVSPWVVTLDALAPFRTSAPTQDVAVLPYLHQDRGRANLDISLEAHIKTPRAADYMRICRTNARHLYWSMAQQLAHQSVNGCPIRVGDMYASGTISGTEPGSYGSMLELAWRATRPLKLPSGETRSFLEDGDCLKITGYAESASIDHKVGFGDVVGCVQANA